ncbi:uncharacterized protein METZ01_LOCUS394606, partial [marine metagenome]
IAVQTGLASWPSKSHAGTESYLSGLPSMIKTKIKEFLNPEKHALLLCYLWILTSLILFTLFRIEHSRYMLPVSPAIAMILAHFFARLEKSENGFDGGIFKVPFLLTIILYLALAAAFAWILVLVSPSLPVPLRVVAFPVFLTIGTVLLILFYLHRRGTRAIIFLSLFHVIVMSSFSGDILPFFNQYPMKAFAREILHHGNGNEPIAVYRLGNNRARLGVMTGQPVYLLSAPSEIAHFAESHKKYYLVMREADWKEEFKDLPLEFLKSDRMWKREKMKKGRLQSVLLGL